MSTEANTGRPLAAVALGAGLALAALCLLGSGAARASVSGATIYVNTTVDEWDENVGSCSLREAIDAANSDSAFTGCPAGSGADTIVLSAGTYTLTRTGVDEDGNSTGDLDVTESLTITGAGAEVTIIDAAGIDRVLDLHSGASSVVLSGVTISGGEVDGDGGGIADYLTDLALVDCNVRNSAAMDDGGGAYVSSATLTISGGEIFGNSADTGGGLATGSGAATLSGGRIYSNGCGSNGGGASFGSGGAYLSGTRVYSNYADNRGGGLEFDTGSSTLSGVEVYSNTASSGGGGAYLHSSAAVTLSSGLVYSNTANSGGGVYIAGAAMWAAGEIVSNTANSGGGVYVLDGGVLTAAANCLIAGNSAGSGGGGGLLVANAYAWLSRAQVISNTASSGGGIYNTSGTATLVNTTVSGNRATSGTGGGLRNDGTTVFTFTTIAGNSATSGGGGIDRTGGTVLLHNTIVANNAPANCAGTITSNDYNLDHANSCGLTQPHDLVNTNPQLAPLARVGGTWIHRLARISPAIDAGLCVDGVTTDQRGALRSAPCDIGSYESIPPVFLPLVLRSY